MNLFDAIFSNDLSSDAIIHGGRQLTYGELRERTIRMAQAFAFLGIAPGDRVALLLHDSPEFIQAFIALCSMGAITVPVNIALKADDQRSILNNSGARLALAEADVCNTVLTGAEEKLRHLTDVLVVERSSGQLQTEFKTLSGVELESASSPVPEFPQPRNDQPAFILYTSGSTGEPKGAVHRQSSIFFTSQSFCREVLQVSKGDRLFSSSRLPFAYGLGNSLTFPLLNGATSILSTERPTPDIIDKILSETRPTIFFAVPVVYNLLLERHRSGKHLDCSSLRVCVSAGEALPAHLGQQWEKEFGVPVLDGIGSTEMLHMFMSNHQTDVRYGTSGKVIAGYAAELRDEHGQPALNGEGNLWIRGESAAIGYWEKPEETNRTFVEGWVRTGDLYQRDQDEYWTHMGRSDDCFKSSGQWVSPVEVEGVLLRHDKVKQVAVVEDFDADRLPCACAFVVCNVGESELESLEKELRELAGNSLPRFKQPRGYVFVDELPYTATGKIQRFKLRQGLRAKHSGA